jgi:hypothetical protein
MFRRVLVFAVALLFFAAPIAADACEVTCAAHNAEHSGHSSNSHHHHSGAGAPASSSQAVNAGPHLCLDTGAILITPKEIRRGLPSPVITSTLIATAAPRLSANPLKVGLDTSSPPFLALTSQLRI